MLQIRLRPGLVEGVTPSIVRSLGTTSGATLAKSFPRQDGLRYEFTTQCRLTPGAVAVVPSQVKD